MLATHEVLSRKLSPTVNNPRPEMIPKMDRKWSSTATDPDWKTRLEWNKGHRIIV